MSDEEKKARKSEYMKAYYLNMSPYQKERKRLKNLENKKRRYYENKVEKPELLYDKHKRFRLKNAEKIKAYQKEYRLKQKEKKNHDD
jgi:hypothetical protein